MTDDILLLPTESVEGEIALVIQYQSGRSEALGVLAAAMGLIESLDRLDHCLLSSIDSGLEPVSILNDVQHSSLKILLARALKRIPDELIKSLDWKKAVGGLLVKGKHKLLSKLDATEEEVKKITLELAPEYKQLPGQMAGYEPPNVKELTQALHGVARARQVLQYGSVTIQTDLGLIELVSYQKWDEVIIEASRSVSSVNLSRVVLQIESLTFKEGNKWRVNDGRGSFYAAMEDAAFMAKIESGERFGKGDVLVADMRQEQQVEEGDTLKTIHTITHVHEHNEPFQRKLSI